MTLREAEANSIRAFVQHTADQGYLSGRVIDYGCGKQPYRDIIEAAGGDYQAYDAPEFPANVGGERHTPDFPHVFDTVLCTQVIQYAPEPRLMLSHIWKQARVLALTYPTHWPEVEKEDLHRFTKAGMERLLTDAGFTIVEHVPRHATKLPGGEVLVHGYGVVAQA